MSDHKREVEKLRLEIAQIDEHLAAALDKRARAARSIGQLAKDDPPALPIRDHASIEALIARSKGDLPAEAMRAIFREIQTACHALELAVRVAFLGPEGGVGHAAAREQFGIGATYVPAASAEEALDAVARQRADFAVLPYETSVDGPVQTTIVALAASDLRIGLVHETGPGAGLDEGRGRVRYAIVGARPSPRTGEDATAIFFSTHDAPGALLEVLGQFAERGINLSRIQSRPAPATRDAARGDGGEGWAYHFFIEVVGHATDRQLVTAFEEVKRRTKFFKVLGSYPARG